MPPEIIVALISGTLSLAGVIITSIVSSTSIRAQLEVNQAVANEKIRVLTESINKVNGVIMTVPKLEQKVDDIALRLEKIEVKTYE